ncbi:MAG: dCTP deaminase [Armatimonadetes bacterium]|nr:dCTP deaminase [Armatimonadota bacterium]
MILSDRDIRAALEAGRIVIGPLEDIDVQIQPCSVDLRLGNRFVIFRTSLKPYIDPRLDDPTAYTEVVEVPDGEVFMLHPGEFVLATTKERVEVPEDLVARVDGRSSIGRLAVMVHATAGFVDAGFRGTVTLELSNVGKMPVALHPNMRICQISFQWLTSPAARPYGSRPGSKYQDQVGPTPSQIHRDREEGR